MCVTKETLTREERDLTSVWLLLASPLHPHHSPGSTLKSQHKYHVCLGSPSWPWSQTPDLASNPANPQDTEQRERREARPPRDGGKIDTLLHRWERDGRCRDGEAESNETDPGPTGGQFLGQETPDSGILGERVQEREV